MRLRCKETLSPSKQAGCTRDVDNHCENHRQEEGHASFDLDGLDGPFPALEALEGQIPLSAFLLEASSLINKEMNYRACVCVCALGLEGVIKYGL